MTDRLTKEQKEFNKYIITNGNYKAFTSTDFKKDKELQELFKIYSSIFLCHPSTARFVDKDYVASFSEKLQQYYTDNYPIDELPINKTFHFKKKKEDERLKSMSNGHKIKELFKIDNLNLAISIYSKEYEQLPIAKDLRKGIIREATQFQHKFQSTTYTEPNELKYDDDKTPEYNKQTYNIRIIIQKVFDWHQYCLSMNQAEAFLIKRYPKWKDSKFQKANRVKINKEINDIADQLQAFDNNIFNSMALKDISKTIKIMVSKFKYEKLLTYNLPNVDEIVAKKITYHLISPFNK